MIVMIISVRKGYCGSGTTIGSKARAQSRLDPSNNGPLPVKRRAVDCATGSEEERSTVKKRERHQMGGSRNIRSTQNQRVEGASKTGRYDHGGPSDSLKAHTKHAADYGLRRHAATTYSPRCPIRLTAVLTFVVGAQFTSARHCKIEFAIREHVSFKV
jgi:hypothetical protein